MSTSIDQAFQIQYVSEVFMAFQRMGARLTGTARLGEVSGSTVRWRKVGRGAATTKARHADLSPMNVEHTYVDATFAEYFAPEFVDKMDTYKTNIDERRVLVETGAYAIGRKVDEVFLTALKKPQADIAHGSAGMTIDKIMQVDQFLNDKDVPNDGNRFGVLPPKAIRDLNLGTGGSDSTLKALYAALARGGEDKPMMPAQEYITIPGSSVKWVMHTGVPYASSTWTCLAWHRSVAGLNYLDAVSAAIDWIPLKVAWLINHGVTVAAKRIDDDGVCAFEMQ